MIGGSLANLRARFRAQFTPAASGWVYRHRGSGPALPVGEQDVLALIAEFDRALRWFSWGGVPLSALIWGVLAWRGVHPGYWTVAVPFVLIVGGLIWWAWRAPLRLLDGRAPVGPALAAGEAWRGNMRTLPWGVVIAGTLVSMALIARVALGSEPWAPHSRTYYAWAALFLCCFAAMAFAKRRAG